jgi:hypothetical protein
MKKQPGVFGESLITLTNSTWWAREDRDKKALADYRLAVRCLKILGGAILFNEIIDGVPLVDLDPAVSRHIAAELLKASRVQESVPFTKHERRKGVSK